MFKSKKHRPKRSKKEEFKELVVTLLVVLVLAVSFRSLAFEPFHIPSGSMKSTLLIGDYIFVSKYNYGYSRYSFPFGIKLFDGRVLKEEPKRGDVIVFKLPSDNSTNYIKRLIGLPGDRVKMIQGELYLNNKKVSRKQVKDFVDSDQEGNRIRIKQYIETLPNGVSYQILDQYTNVAADNTIEYTVPEGHYFFMGDNRDNSQDSRFLDAVGFVPEVNLVGKARLVLFSSNQGKWKFGTSIH